MVYLYIHIVLSPEYFGVNPCHSVGTSRHNGNGGTAHLGPRDCATLGSRMTDIWRTSRPRYSSVRARWNTHLSTEVGSCRTPIATGTPTRNACTTREPYTASRPVRRVWRARNSSVATTKTITWCCLMTNSGVPDHGDRTTWDSYHGPKPIRWILMKNIWKFSVFGTIHLYQLI